jgi:hypothetical protein
VGRLVTPPIENQIENFMFAVFSSNPIKDSVKVSIDDGGIRFVMKREKFAKIVNDLCGYEIKTMVEIAMNEFGESYLLDRMNGTLQHLTPEQLDNFNITNIGKDAREEMQKSNPNPTFKYEGWLKRAYNEMLGDFKPKKRNVDGYVDYRKKK